MRSISSWGDERKYVKQPSASRTMSGAGERCGRAGAVQRGGEHVASRRALQAFPCRFDLSWGSGHPENGLEVVFQVASHLKSSPRAFNVRFIPT